MYAKTIALTCLALGSLLVSPAKAAEVDFSGVDLADVSSVAGQNFSYTVGSGPATGTVNVRLLSGDASAVTAGDSPDTTGFYAKQYDPAMNGSGLTPAVYEFTLSGPQTFTVTQNESLTTYETNGFTLLPSGVWSVLSSSFVNTTENGSNISFQGAGGANEQPPYGNYSIGGTGTGFDFIVTDATGLVDYGNAISLDIEGVPEPGPSLLLVGGGLALWLGRRRFLPA